MTFELKIKIKISAEAQELCRIGGNDEDTCGCLLQCIMQERELVSD